VDAEAGFESRCAAHRRALVAYLYAQCGDFHAAEDLAQEALLIASRKREHYFPEADFGAWLRAIARNVWMRERRAGRRRPLLAEGVAEELADDLFAAPAYAEPRWQAEKAALADCLGELDGEDRKLLRGHFSAARRYGELARRAGRTLAWVKVRMFRARRQLADCIRRKLGPGTEPAP
jgi:RNA polymerase sigma-70 factor (ECF subfamily)